MMTTKRLAGLALAAVFAGALLGEAVSAEAGQPAPLPVQIPIRDASEPPSPPLEARSFVPTPVHHRKSRRTRPAKRRRPVAPSRSARTPKAPPAPKAPPSGSSGLKLEQRPEAATESIMSLDAIPGPANGQAAGPKPAPAPTASPGPSPAEFPPSPAPAPAPAPAKP